MKLRYLSIHQQNEEFYLTKIPAMELFDKLNFHFRQPYANSPEDSIEIKKYLDNLENQGISMSNNPEGIQRRLQIARINKIKEFLESDSCSFFPNCVILSIFIDEENLDTVFGKDKDGNYISLEEPISFQIVDGQHRLAGLYKTKKEITQDFDVPIILFINVTQSFCAKLFVDVNGNQAPVPKSVIYDLCELTPNSEKFENELRLHYMCKQFNENVDSPLYKHIKMLGIGKGAISQAFFVDALNRLSKEIFSDVKLLSNSNVFQQFYNSIFFYLKSYQRIFQQQWPVLEKYETLEEFWTYSNLCLKENKSQILKTNGLGGILRAFPSIYKYLGKEQSFKSYFTLIEKLNGKINWETDFNEGTGFKNQMKVKDAILKSLEIYEN